MPVGKSIFRRAFLFLYGYMSLISSYSELKQISRRLLESNSSITCLYSHSQLHLRWTPPTPKQERINRLMSGLLIGIWVAVGIYQAYYILLIALALIGLVWWLRKRRGTVDMYELRLQNDIQIDTTTKQILLQNINMIYRELVAQEKRVLFSEVRGVDVQSSGYAGILYLNLTDNSKLFLLEVEAENIAQHIAQVFRKVLGLPQPARKSWWPF